MDFRSLSVKDFFETYPGKDLCEKYAPNLLKYPLKLFYKKNCGEIFDLCMKKNIVPPEAAAKIQAEVEAW